MSGGRKVKQAGTAFEYRVRDWFQARAGWKAERNPLSGASGQVSESMGKHDVRAWNDSLFFQIECKKRTRVKDPKKRNQIEVLKEWIDNIDYENDEFLCVGFDRSKLYVVITTERFEQILGRKIAATYDDSNTFTGKTQFVFKEDYFAEQPRFHLYWKGVNCETYTALTLEDFVTLRETADIHDDLTIEEQLKRINDLPKLERFEKDNLESLSYGQKKLLYQKFEAVEAGVYYNPRGLADSQFWLDDAFVCICPHCEEKITTKDLKRIDESAK